MRRSIDLFKMDYNIFTLNNEAGQFCGNYPSQLIVPTFEIMGKRGSPSDSPIYEENEEEENDELQLTEATMQPLITAARTARFVLGFFFIYYVI